MNADESATKHHVDRLTVIAGLLVLPIVLVASDGVLRGQEEAHDVRPTAIAADGPASLEYHAPDDVAAWGALEVLVPEGGDRTRWIEEAGGSTSWEERTPDLWVKGRRPGPRGELVGYSRLEGDRDSATRGATESAVRQITALVIWSLRERVSQPELIDFRELATLAEAEARKSLGSVRVDGFEQSVDRPYGRLYRAAVLVRVGEKDLERIGVKLQEAVARAEARARDERRVLAWKGGIGIALTLLTALGYLAVNALTKGYYTWRLRLFSLLGLGAAYAVLVLIRV